MSKRKIVQKRHAWQPMQPAVPVVMTPEQEAAVQDMGGADLVTELRNNEMWINDRYVVVVTRRKDDDTICELSIRRKDRRAVHDWRDFQRIKTEIAGAETEAFELYPAESRLMDTANQYYLHVFRPGEQIPAGYIGPRVVTEGRVLNSQQRNLPDDWKRRDDLVTSVVDKLLNQDNV